MMFEEATAPCPYCFENIAVPIDPGGGNSQETIVDCEVCCQPILVKAYRSDESEEYQAHLERS